MTDAYFYRTAASCHVWRLCLQSLQLVGVLMNAWAEIALVLKRDPLNLIGVIPA